VAALAPVASRRSRGRGAEYTRPAIQTCWSPPEPPFHDHRRRWFSVPRSSSSPAALTTARDPENCGVKTSRGRGTGEPIGDVGTSRIADDEAGAPLKSDRPGEPGTPAMSTRWISASEQRSAVAIARNERPARCISVAAERRWRAGAVYSSRLIRERSRAASRARWRTFSRSRCAAIRASRSSGGTSAS